VTVLEQAAVFWEAGAGLTITPNGESALAALGLDRAVREAGHSLTQPTVRPSEGQWRLRLGDESASPPIGIHRRSLHATLLDAANEHAELRPGVRVLGVDVGHRDGRPARVRCLEPSGECTYMADLVIGADGANSTLRPGIAPAADVRPSGYSAWRAVVPDDHLVGSDWTTWWGPGLEFAAQRIGADRVSWHCMYRSDRREVSPDDLGGVLALFDGWPQEVRSLISRTAPTGLFKHDIADVRGYIPSFVSGRTVLIGDAAHPMLPTIHQGANLALEDAITLAALLQEGPSLNSAFDQYDRARLPRCQRLASRAELAASLGAGCPEGLEQLVRDTTLARLPASWAGRYGGAICSWRAPLLSAHGA
jgi:2-polyprenyl-6-methoxyphenol hydroxylase-like FAD-dependent oxidoreductase